MSAAAGGLVGALAAILLAVPAAAAAEAEPRGVNPKDLTTKFDAIYERDERDGGLVVQGLALKYDRGLGGPWGLNLEAPVVRVSAAGRSEGGLGDTNLRLRWVANRDGFAYVAGAELVAPTASDDLLGRGRWQFNPAIGAVYAVSPTAFVFAGYKHVRSLGRDAQRTPVNASEPRLLAAVTSRRGWWMLTDARYVHDWEAGAGAAEVDVETGRMLATRVAAYARLGTGFGGSDRRWKLNVGTRYLF